MAEAKNPTLLKLCDWPMFRPPAGYRQHKSPVVDGRAPPRISDLIMAFVSGGPSKKLAWLQEQKAAGKLDGDDPDEIIRWRAKGYVDRTREVSRHAKGLGVGADVNALDVMPDNRCPKGIPGRVGHGESRRRAGQRTIAVYHQGQDARVVGKGVRAPSRLKVIRSTCFHGERQPSLTGEPESCSTSYFFL